MIVKWKVCSYDDLSKKELHQIMILRQKVFVVEQDCPYQDADDKDIYTWLFQKKFLDYFVQKAFDERVDTYLED